MLGLSVRTVSVRNGCESLCEDAVSLSDPLRGNRTPRYERTPILRYFEFEHLPHDLKMISREFHTLAHKMAGGLEPGPETSVCLRKLLEAKDAAVRAALND